MRMPSELLSTFLKRNWITKSSESTSILDTRKDERKVEEETGIKSEMISEAEIMNLGLQIVPETNMKIEGILNEEMINIMMGEMMEEERIEEAEENDIKETNNIVIEIKMTTAREKLRKSRNHKNMNNSNTDVEISVYFIQ